MKPYFGLLTLIRINSLYSIPRCFLVFCLLLPFSQVLADGNEIESFHASYDLYKNDKHVGETSLQAELNTNSMRMRMTTRPGGLYAIITSQQPYAETTMSRQHGDFRLEKVLISPHVKQPPLEVAEFDWQEMVLIAKRNNKKQQIPMTEAAYDFLSIHWLAAQLILANADQFQLKFYRKGKLMTSTLFHSGTETIELAGEQIETSVFEQTFTGSSRRIKYHYDLRNPWLPVRIERTRKGKKKTVLLLNSLQNSR